MFAAFLTQLHSCQPPDLPRKVPLIQANPRKQQQSEQQRDVDVQTLRQRALVVHGIECWRERLVRASTVVAAGSWHGSAHG